MRWLAQADAGALLGFGAQADAAANAQGDTEAPAVDAAQAGTAPPAPAITAGAWLDTFRADMRAVLLAELDVRFQPVEGLLAALRTS